MQTLDASVCLCLYMRLYVRLYMYAGVLVFFVRERVCLSVYEHPSLCIFCYAESQNCSMLYAIYIEGACLLI